MSRKTWRHIRALICWTIILFAVAIALMSWAMVLSGRAAGRDQIEQFQRVEHAGMIHLVYIVSSEQKPTYRVNHGRLGAVYFIKQPDRWYGSLNAAIDPCHGSLVINERVVTAQRCVHFPIATKGK